MALFYDYSNYRPYYNSSYIYYGKTGVGDVDYYKNAHKWYHKKYGINVPHYFIKGLYGYYHEHRNLNDFWYYDHYLDYRHKNFVTNKHGKDLTYQFGQYGDAVYWFEDKLNTVGDKKLPIITKYVPYQGTRGVRNYVPNYLRSRHKPDFYYTETDKYEQDYKYYDWHSKFSNDYIERNYNYDRFYYTLSEPGKSYLKRLISDDLSKLYKKMVGRPLYEGEIVRTTDKKLFRSKPITTIYGVINTQPLVDLLSSYHLNNIRERYQKYIGDVDVVFVPDDIRVKSGNHLPTRKSVDKEEIGEGFNGKSTAFFMTPFSNFDSINKYLRSDYYRKFINSQSKNIYKGGKC